MPSPASKGTHHVGRLLVIILEGNNLVCSKDGKVKVIAIETVSVPAFVQGLVCLTLIFLTNVYIDMIYFICLIVR